MEVTPKTRRNETTGVDEVDEQKMSTEGQPPWEITALFRAPEADRLNQGLNTGRGTRGYGPMII